MKKIIIIALAIITTGLVSCSKDSSVKPATVQKHNTTTAIGPGDLTYED